MQKFLRTQFGYTYDYSVNNLQDIKNCLYANQSRGTVYSGAQARMVRLTKHNSAHREVYDWLAEEVFSYLMPHRRMNKTLLEYKVLFLL